MDSKRILVGLVVVACVAGMFARVPVALAGCLPNGTEITWSDPPDGFIDVRQHEDGNSNPDGISQVTVRFSQTLTLTAGCIEVVSTGSTPPEVDSVTKDGDDWVIELDGPVEAAESTALVFDAGVAWVMIHSHPGDVNLDGTSNDDDVTALEAAIELETTDPDIHDIDRDGTVDNDDVTRLEFVLETYDGMEWVSEARVICCCAFGECAIYGASQCPDGDTEVDCPCASDSCTAVPAE